MEIGPDHCSYAYWQRSTNTISRLKFVSFIERESEEKLPELLQAMLQQPVSAAYISSAFPQAMLVPTKYFQQNCDLLRQQYPLERYTCLHDTINDWQMVNLYALPQPVHQQVSEAFSNAAFFHVYTPAIQVYNGYAADSQLNVHFTPGSFRVLLKKESSLQLAQTYSYSSPLDVVYFLLKICLEFSLEQAEVFLILSGLVEKDSNLFTEMEQYFANIHFAHPPEIKLPGSDLPHYFFTSLYNLAVCVS